MKQIFSRRMLWAIIFPAALLFSFTTIIDKVNFSGTWKLDEGKSELGNFAAFAARTIKAEQKDSAITITRTSPGFNGGQDRTTTTTISYDGKITESTGFGGSKIKASGKWADNGQSFTINSTITFDRNGQSNELKFTETWTLTKDGMLSLVTNSTGPNGDATTTAIYSK